MASAQLNMAACDDLLLTAPVWRYKICKFHALTLMKNKIQELQLQAAAMAVSSTTAPTSTFRETNAVADTEST